MTDRRGRRARHKRHKASTQWNRLVWAIHYRIGPKPCTPRSIERAMRRFGRLLHKYGKWSDSGWCEVGPKQLQDDATLVQVHCYSPSKDQR